MKQWNKGPPQLHRVLLKTEFCYTTKFAATYLRMCNQERPRKSERNGIERNIL